MDVVHLILLRKDLFHLFISVDRSKRQVSTYPKFFAKFAEQYDVCYGQIQSPGFPALYQNDAVAYAVLRAPEQHVSKLYMDQRADLHVHVGKKDVKTLMEAKYTYMFKDITPCAF